MLTLPAVPTDSAAGNTKVGPLAPPRSGGPEDGLKVNFAQIQEQGAKNSTQPVGNKEVKESGRKRRGKAKVVYELPEIELPTSMIVPRLKKLLDAIDAIPLDLRGEKERQEARYECHLFLGDVTFLQRTHSAELRHGKPSAGSCSQVERQARGVSGGVMVAAASAHRAVNPARVSAKTGGFFPGDEGVQRHSRGESPPQDFSDLDGDLSTAGRRSPLVAARAGFSRKSSRAGAKPEQVRLWVSPDASERAPGALPRVGDGILWPGKSGPTKWDGLKSGAVDPAILYDIYCTKL